MKNIAIKTIITIFVISFFFTYTLNGMEINLDEYNISINQEIDEQSVIENIIIMDNFNESTNELKFWITDDAKNILFLVNNQETTFENINNNEYILNISSTEIGNESIIKISISYSLDRNIKEFKKMVIGNTSKILIEFDGNNILNAENLASGTYFSLRLYEPTETPLSIYIVGIIILIIIVIIIFSLYILRRSRKPKIKDLESESEELLNAKKTLLMSVLKEIEKQYRSKQISDNTYHKLKEFYKQQAIVIMKKLDDLKSKI